MKLTNGHNAASWRQDGRTTGPIIGDSVCVNEIGQDRAIELNVRGFGAVPGRCAEVVVVLPRAEWDRITREMAAAPEPAAKPEPLPAVFPPATTGNRILDSYLESMAAVFEGAPESERAAAADGLSRLVRAFEAKGLFKAVPR